MADCQRPKMHNLRCRKCNACLEHRQRTWLLRMILESKMYASNEIIFVTLTYNDAHLPSTQELAKISVQKFFKRLRKGADKKIRYVAALESGSQNTCRYHWHAIIYGLTFDSITTHIIRKTWGQGFVDVKPASHGRMSYVLKYVIKKNKFLMSRRPGIGHGMIQPLQKLLESLSRAERIKLRSNFSSVHYPDAESKVTRINIGGYDYPIHDYLKKHLYKPVAQIDKKIAHKILEDIYGKASDPTF